MPSGWQESLPKKQLKWQRLPMNNRPFEMKLKNGLVSKARIYRNSDTHYERFKGAGRLNNL
jgi:hypothetical protein